MILVSLDDCDQCLNACFGALGCFDSFMFGWVGQPILSWLCSTYRFVCAAHTVVIIDNKANAVQLQLTTGTELGNTYEYK